MATTITYEEKHTSANTVYADISMNEKLYMLNKIEHAFYELLERANYDTESRNILAEQNKAFNRHIASGDLKVYNSVQSFIAGLLKQHQNSPSKDISTKMLKGIELATELFCALGLDCPHYTFTKQTKTKTATTPYERFFK